ncbi:MAG: hypothetical protein LBU69_04795 [Deltaproteobacteria bacterium]|nr:hypothetical protein [Deltaproteobacteria bacterium]
MLPKHRPGLSFPKQRNLRDLALNGEFPDICDLPKGDFWAFFACDLPKGDFWDFFAVQASQWGYGPNFGTPNFLPWPVPGGWGTHAVFRADTFLPERHWHRQLESNCHAFQAGCLAIGRIVAVSMTQPYGPRLPSLGAQAAFFSQSRGL